MTINHILLFILVSFITTGVLALINRHLKKKAETSENQKSTGTELLIKRIIFLLLCFTLPVASVLMFGPQLFIIVPLLFCLGVFFVFRRSFLSLICFGYPLSYGLFSAYVGFHELNDYTKATEFWVALGIGIVGVDLIAVGLLKTLFKKNHS
jgi:hypothetical protein